MDFMFRFPKDSYGNTGIVVFVECLSKINHLAAVPDIIDGEGTAMLFIDRVFRQHGLPLAIIYDRNRRFTKKIWKSVSKVLGIRLDMLTAGHPRTDCQTERINRVIGDILRSVNAERQSVGFRRSLWLSLRRTTLACLHKLQIYLCERSHTLSGSVSSTTTWFRAW